MLILLFTYLLKETSHAQSNRFIHISSGIQSSAERDYGYSPLIYDGLGGYISIDFSSNGLSNSKRYSVSYSSGSLNNKWAKNMKVYTANFQVYKFYHRNRDPLRGIHWGWSNNNESSIRDNELAENFNFRSDHFTSFGGAVRIRLPLEILSKYFYMETLAHFQLLGLKMSSSYVDNNLNGFTGEVESGFNALMNSLELFYPGNSLNFGIWPGLTHELKTGNMIGINYRYDYISLSGTHLSQKSRGKFFLSLLFKI